MSTAAELVSSLEKYEKREVEGPAAVADLHFEDNHGVRGAKNTTPSACSGTTTTHHGTMWCHI